MYIDETLRLNGSSLVSRILIIRSQELNVKNELELLLKIRENYRIYSVRIQNKVWLYRTTSSSSYVSEKLRVSWNICQSIFGRKKPL